MKILLTVLAATLLLTACAKPVTTAEAEKIVDAYISTQTEAGEGAVPKGIALGDLNGDGKPEIAAVWMVSGPTYWIYHLTVFERKDDTFAPAATLQLVGEARPPKIENNLIAVDQTVYADNDPICCPTVGEHNKYTWTGAKIALVSEEPAPVKDDAKK